MPSIDVTELTLDPDLAGSFFTVIRRQEGVNSFGESVLTSTTIPNLVGQVSPQASRLTTEEAFAADIDAIQVITKFRLRGVSTDGSHNFQPDLVLWKGNYYKVRTSNDYSQFGQGFLVADCESFNYVDSAPT